MDLFHIQGHVLDPEVDSYYSNVTGFIHGDAAFTNITLPSLASNDAIGWKHEAEKFMTGVNTTNMTEKLGTWHWDTTTKVAISVLEKNPAVNSAPSVPSGPITLIRVRPSL